ncbi:hypothetical protein GCM10010924_24860 [Rhizobium wenxiniae]|uniref:DUF2591 domain-containing protein n=1 Tax=Rhizobium wenxiniae TaxID=1737357 RepID=A0A7W9Y7E3_9HYPH|nr:hypothetical protein [Rhizobium wenxiniae]MBB6162803.1 hypothetical protein [Rhizobium wenxiniae]GGF95778.1 hypothetical protein GCM10010924_24860 [Rhizobium wenxiniae]
MNIVDVIKDLNSANEGTRVLDEQLAQLLGWARRTKSLSDVSKGEKKAKEPWHSGDSPDPRKVPFYTSNLGHAFQFAEELCPRARLGSSWEDRRGSARINDDRYVQAATPQIALCIAALMTAMRGGLFSQPSS